MWWESAFFNNRLSIFNWPINQSYYIIETLRLNFIVSFTVFYVLLKCFFFENPILYVVFGELIYFVNIIFYFLELTIISPSQMVCYQFGTLAKFIRHLLTNFATCCFQSLWWYFAHARNGFLLSSNWPQSDETHSALKLTLSTLETKKFSTPNLLLFGHTRLFYLSRYAGFFFFSRTHIILKSTLLI